MINILIFSRNRPMQLDLLLRSMAVNMERAGWRNVIYRTDGDEYYKNYRQVINKSTLIATTIHHESEKDFKDSVLLMFEKFQEKFTAIFVDDDVVINPIHFNQILNMFTAYHQSISLSLGLSCTYCYAQGYPESVPSYQMVDGIIQWKWPFAQSKSDWSYPMTFDGGIYETDWLWREIKSLDFDSPNLLAGLLDANKDWMRPYQLAFAQQKVFNVAAKLVQTVCKNRHGERYAYSVKELNDRYNDGLQISLNNFIGKVFDSPNGEHEYIFEKA